MSEEPLNGGGWALLLTAAAFPIIVFALAFATGWKRRAGAFALIMLSGLGIVAVFWMNVLAYAAVYGLFGHSVGVRLAG